MTDQERKELHTKTIVMHIELVKDLCNKLGIPDLGATHDISKFDDDEFEIYHWADGTCSPHDNARAELGYSPSWFEHLHRNRHHWERWVGYNSAKKLPDGRWSVNLECIKIPYKYIIEMLADFIAAGKVYEKTKWTTKTPWSYWGTKCEGDRAMHPDSEKLFKFLLKKLSEFDELDDFISWYTTNKDKLSADYLVGNI